MLPTSNSTWLQYIICMLYRTLLLGLRCGDKEIWMVKTNAQGYKTIFLHLGPPQQRISDIDHACHTIDGHRIMRVGLSQSGTWMWPTWKLDQRWATVYDAGAALDQHRDNLSCLLGIFDEDACQVFTQTIFNSIDDYYKNIKHLTLANKLFCAIR